MNRKPKDEPEDVEQDTPGEDESDLPEIDPEIEIGGNKVHLTVPSSISLCEEITVAAGSNFRRAAGAALGACWVGKGRPRVKYAACDYNPLKYGGMVIDELVDRGIPLDEVLAAGMKAWALVRTARIKGSEVKAKAGFTGAGEAG